MFNITVDDPQKVGDPIRSFTMYTVHTKTTSPLYAKSSFSVLRRYSDFLWLYETLSANNPGVVVPPVSEKNTFGRFDDQFVRQRRVALEKCIRKIANHPVLSKDADLKMFLESDSFALDIKHRKAEIASEKGGLIASIGQSFTGPRFYETDEVRFYFVFIVDSGMDGRLTLPGCVVVRQTESLPRQPRVPAARARQIHRARLKTPCRCVPFPSRTSSPPKKKSTKIKSKPLFYPPHRIGDSDRRVHTERDRPVRVGRGQAARTLARGPRGHRALSTGSTKRAGGARSDDAHGDRYACNAFNILLAHSKTVKQLISIRQRMNMRG